ncbi:MAG: DUF3604 domain-containing protein [Candidatus Andeanibacterium colombiense]|uniref:DUF3604 domain-containing protein n=1 Tax=Candidatus Andeanibacterium colombiense TaxID=3121345 RepID=A0AAJ6BNQ5_9SPHN|nr:MAG: DUF3604 domain-containing protein [Sphingomonadaceae bacterium]
MKKSGKWLIAGAATAALAYHVVIGFGSPTLEAAAPGTVAAGPVKAYADREAFFGDLHLHTTNSFDAYVLMGTKTTPDDAYKFARGDTIQYLGQPIRRSEPLDFLAVTDHSENLGVFNQLDDPKSEFSLSEVGKLARQGGYENFIKLVVMLQSGTKLGGSAEQVSASTWQRNIQAANANYQPGKFTTFIAYEWTSMPSGQNLHRNVIFRGNTAPNPFTSQDSRDPQDLWTWLSKIRGQGYEALAIPHNANASNGLMYDWNTLSGRPIDEAYAQLRLANEPLAEVAQNKGSSETHPALSGNDEFANYEIFDKLLIGNAPSKPGGSYWRDALGRGLVIGGKIGVNPYKDGAVGGSDLHSGLSVSSAQEYGGAANANLGGGKLDKARAAQEIGQGAQPAALGLNTVVLSPGNLTGVWANSNTREDIYAAFRRKETFATSGSKLKVRFFGGWDFAPTLLKQADWVRSAYGSGVPMGSDLPAAKGGKAPSFVVEAVKDPNGGNLDRLQVIKVWLENGKQQERVFDVAWSGKRAVDPKTGKLPAVGNTVNLKTGRYTNSIGAAQLSTVWTDPSFKADQAAVYYVRVLEIPTPRWSTLRSIEFGLPLSKDVPPTLQQRGWTSPIWYTPARIG